ncbi:MAG TPA: transcriptional repressor [Deltaproteobacteria bacterium]|jgi:Fur family ferric uptake transcriptional regulator|nr:transcriptional repressor [Deltaproteobacteria bacterium]HQI01634.1 transcriptional repressor [Deltaproteobacteria bacterium]HQJ07380.1 transcriptional repressor [Deltaproteobacteria bacterium]
MADKKFRMTEQRRIIFDELKKTYEHPSASDIYEKVKQRLPHISLGTVYRNLEILAARGIIKKLDMASGQRRFDAGVHAHHHIRCISCGRVDDVPSDSPTSLGSILAKVKKVSGYDEVGCAADFYGICPKCAGSEVRGDRRKI